MLPPRTFTFDWAKPSTTATNGTPRLAIMSTPWCERPPLRGAPHVSPKPTGPWTGHTQPGPARSPAAPPGRAPAPVLPVRPPPVPPVDLSVGPDESMSSASICVESTGAFAPSWLWDPTESWAAAWARSTSAAASSWRRRSASSACNACLIASSCSRSASTCFNRSISASASSRRRSSSSRATSASAWAWVSSACLSSSSAFSASNSSKSSAEVSFTTSISTATWACSPADRKPVSSGSESVPLRVKRLIATFSTVARSASICVCRTAMSRSSACWESSSWSRSLSAWNNASAAALARSRASAISSAACWAASSDSSARTDDDGTAGTSSAIPARIAQSARMCTERYLPALIRHGHPPARATS